jgi:hypothetical protein
MGEILDALGGMIISLPALELAILIAVVAMCLVMKFNQAGLITSYLFVYRWGWSFCVSHEPQYLMGYLIFGCLVGILTVVGMLKSTT